MSCHDDSYSRVDVQDAAGVSSTLVDCLQRPRCLCKVLRSRNSIMFVTGKQLVEPLCCTPCVAASAMCTQVCFDYQKRHLSVLTQLRGQHLLVNNFRQASLAHES